MTLPATDLGELEQVFAHMAHRVVYGFGAKAPSLDCDSSAIHQIDCSGFVRYALAKSTGQQLIIPDGSDNQHHWAEQNLRQVQYADVQRFADPTRLFIAFIKPGAEHVGSAGHVWLLQKMSNGLAMTTESHGGVGVSSRPWDTDVLKRYVSGCYEIVPTK